MQYLIALVMIGIVVGWLTGHNSSAELGWTLFGCLAGMGALLFNRVRARAVKETTDACAAAGDAVTYHWWHGSVHDFTFTSHDYVTAFANANNRKTMSDIEEVSAGFG